MKENHSNRSTWHMYMLYKKALSWGRSFKMTKRIVSHLSLLKKLKKCKPLCRKKFLQSGGKSLQVCLRECAVNILKGNVRLTKAQKTRLQKYKKQIREISKKRTSQKKRLQLEQKGGFLPALIAPVLGAVLGGLFKKK